MRYVIFNEADETFFEPFDAENDDDAMLVLKCFACSFGDDVSSYSLFTDLEVFN